ncbi:hypothetical protein [Chitinophaga sp. CF418]|uniref:hypothetical protein n=1 Tax=Chitinophaga sp. CF418 TaxID=1855287 RepID=UPI0009138276|nr:hypothetical protein [Chitinophaga sp. CF418]SHN35677.1 hypothetical protein SAMN05216311_1106 [Chitinophaga sp. CF418]
MPTREIDGIEYQDLVIEDWLESLEAQQFYHTETNRLKAKKKYLIGTLDVKYFVPADFILIAFEDCIFSGKVVFHNHNYAKVEFKNCVFEDDVRFVGGDFKKQVIFNGGKIQGRFEIINGNFERIDLSMNCNEVYITGGKFTNFAINSFGHSDLFSINDLVILSQGISGNISISRMNIASTNLWGNIHKDAELSFKNISFTHLKIEGLFNNGKLRFFDLVPVKRNTAKPSLFIMNSNLSKTDFFSLPIDKLERFEMYNSFFIDCTFVNVTWPAEFDTAMDGAHYSALLDRKEMFRQLKYSYSKQGDSVIEHKFHGLEMDIYREYLKRKRRDLKDIGNYSKWRTDRQTSIILWFSSWSSNYGQSFKAPLYTLLAAGVVLFAVMVTCGFIQGFQAGFHFDFSWPQISTTAGHFFSFINPLRKYEGQELNIGVLLDSVMRIIASYCIYNFIRATRRFVK